MTARHEEKARAAATRVARESYGKLVAYLAAPARDVPGRRRRARRRLCRRPRRLANEGCADQSRGLAGEDRAAAAHRCRAPAPQRG